MHPQISMGALTLAASLKRVNTSRKLAIMVTSEGWLVMNIIIIMIVINHQQLVIMVTWLQIQRRTTLSA